MAAIDQAEGLAFGQGDQIAVVDQRHPLGGDLVPGHGRELHAGSRLRRVGGRRHDGHEADLRVLELVGEDLGGFGVLDPQHDQVVEVALHLAGAGFVAEFHLHVRPGLGVHRHLERGATGLVEQRHELGADQLVEFVGMDAHPALWHLHGGQAMVEAVFVDAPGDGGQIGEHGVAHRRRHFGVGQGIQPHIHNAAFADDLVPVDNGTLIVAIVIIRRQQLTDLAGGELFDERQQVGGELVEIGFVVLEGGAQAVRHGVIQTVLLGVSHQGEGVAVASAQCHGQGFEIAVVALEGAHAGAPVFRPLFVEPPVEILHQQRLDVGDIAGDQGVVRFAAQPQQGAGHHVGETPGELAEGRGIALVRQLAGDPAGHLGDPAKLAHRVVAGGQMGIAQMKDVEVVQPPGAFGLAVAAAHQIGIAFGIEDDGHIPPADVLGD